MDRDQLFRIVLPVTGLVVLMLAGILAYLRWYTGSTNRAHASFEAAMRAVVGRLGLSYHPPSSALDFPGVLGTHRGHRVAFFIVSETESPMMTGLSVHFASPLSADLLAGLKARTGFIRRAKLDVRARGGSGAILPPAIAERLDAFIAPKDIDQVDIASDHLLLTLKGDRYSFFNYCMLTDPERLLAITEAAVDFAVVLEQAAL